MAVGAPSGRRWTRLVAEAGPWALALLLGFAALTEPRARAEEDPAEPGPDRIEGPGEQQPSVIQRLPDDVLPTASLTVEAVGFRNRRGRALVAMFRTPKGFPTKLDKAAWKHAYPIGAGGLKIAMSNVPTGMVAFVVLHDENGNERLDTRLFGFRSEGYGTSRDAQALLGAPDFYDAAIGLGGGERRYLRIPLHY